VRYSADRFEEQRRKTHRRYMFPSALWIPGFRDQQGVSARGIRGIPPSHFEGIPPSAAIRQMV
jgi:hypothetical protein